MTIYLTVLFVALYLILFSLISKELLLICPNASRNRAGQNISYISHYFCHQPRKTVSIFTFHCTASIAKSLLNYFCV